MRTGGREWRKRVVRLIIMYTSAEIWVSFLGGIFLPKCFHSRSLCTSAYCHRNRVSYFLMAKYCPALSQHYADAGRWWERGGPPVRLAAILSLHLLGLLLCWCQAISVSLHSATQCSTMGPYPQHRGMDTWVNKT